MNKHYFLVFPFPWIFLVVFMLHTETQGNPNDFDFLERQDESAFSHHDLPWDVIDIGSHLAVSTYE